MKKKLIAALLAGAMVLSIAGCGEAASSSAASSAASAAASAASSAVSAVSEAATSAASSAAAASQTTAASSEETTAASSSSETTAASSEEAASGLETVTLGGLTATYDPSVYYFNSDYGVIQLIDLATAENEVPLSITMSRTGTPLEQDIDQDYMDAISETVAATPGDLGEKVKVLDCYMGELEDGTPIGMMETQKVWTDEYIDNLINMGWFTEEDIESWGGRGVLIGYNISMQTVLYVPVEGELVTLSCIYDMVVNADTIVDGAKAIVPSMKLDQESWEALLAAYAAPAEADAETAESDDTAAESTSASSSSEG